jgi:hypothetical protein
VSPGLKPGSSTSESGCKSRRRKISAQEAARGQTALAPAAPLPGPLPLTERLTRRQADLAARSERLAAVTTALTPLYAMLSAEQKAVADNLIRTSEDGDVVIRRGRNRDR